MISAHSHLANSSRCFSINWRWSTKMFTKMPIKPTSILKLLTTKKSQRFKCQRNSLCLCLQSEADHQGCKIPLTEIRWLGPHIIEKMLANNNYRVRKIGSNKTQVLDSLRMHQFTPRQPSTDIRITPQELKPDPDVRLEHDDLYART